MIHSIAPTELIYKYNILSGVYTPACDIPLLRSLFLSDTNKKIRKLLVSGKIKPFLIPHSPFKTPTLIVYSHSKNSKFNNYWCPVKNKEISQRTNK